MERSGNSTLLCKSCQQETANSSPLSGLARICKSCSCEFTASRWAYGLNTMFKLWIICQECGKKKKLCLICCINLDLNLPVQVRYPGFGINTNYSLPTGNSEVDYLVGKARPNEAIPKCIRPTPYYKKERTEACRYYAEGECKKGDACSFRHERKCITPIEDSIRTLHVGGIGIDDTIRITEEDLRGKFCLFGEIESVCMVLRSKCAFVTYFTREGAEKAITELMNKLYLKGRRLKLSWAKSQTVKAAEKMYMQKMDKEKEEERQKILLKAGKLAAEYLYPPENQYMHFVTQKKMASVEASCDGGSDEIYEN